FRIMAGVEEHERSPADGAYLVLLILTYLAVYAFPVLAAAYLWFVGRDVWQRRRAKRSSEE
ncbi:MAG TPA: hypothetical protein VKU40_12315, partial [Thermoanaerobaculia bacterium]|nr:hypothetical protein [Thermoanaerobaculia bacterium]